jgi:AcrR family transcriptional regulator
VRAAFDAIAAEGFEGLRMRTVGAAAGVDHSTIHHYFDSKEALIEAVVAYATGQFRSTTPPAGTAAGRLAAHLRTLGERIVAEPGLHAVLRELDLRARRDEGLRATIDAHERGWRASLTGLLTQGMRDGALNQALAPETAAELIIAAVKGASLNPAAAPAALSHLYVLLAYTGAQQDRPDPEG